jgi:hypothetical protein
VCCVVLEREKEHWEKGGERERRERAERKEKCLGIVGEDRGKASAFGL